MDFSSNAHEHFHRGVIAMDNERYDSALEHFRADQRLEPTRRGHLVNRWLGIFRGQQREVA